MTGTIGRLAEPVLKPLGFNWKIGVGLITSLAAREVIVGTLGTIYGMEGEAHSVGLQRALRQDLTIGGVKKDGSDVLVLEVTGIEYDVPVEDQLFSTQVPAGAVQKDAMDKTAGITATCEEFLSSQSTQLPQLARVK